MEYTLRAVDEVRTSLLHSPALDNQLGKKVNETAGFVFAVEYLHSVIFLPWILMQEDNL